MHFVIWHHKFNGEHRLRKWTITSIDTDQYIHVLLAMARGRIEPEGLDNTEVTVRRRRGKGACDFLYVNRVYSAIADHDSWRSGLADGDMEPSWLTREAKVVLFVVVYALAGCDFLPSVYNLPFKKMLALTMESICQKGLFDEALVERDETGKWTLPLEHGMKLMAVCYVMMHRKVFSAANTTAADVFRQCERNTTTFIQTVRETIWRAHGASGKKNCPAPDALGYQVQRCGAVLSYWQSAFDEEMELPEFRGEGWQTVSGAEENLTAENVAIQLSEYALLSKGGKLKFLTCGCNPDKDPKCDKCRCYKAGR